MFGDFAGQCLGEHASLEFEGAAVLAEGVVTAAVELERCLHEGPIGFGCDVRVVLLPHSR